MGNIATALPQLLHLYDRVNDGIAAAEAGITACEEVGEQSGAANAFVALGTLYERINDFDRAEQANQAALEKAISRHLPVPEINARLGLASIALRRRDLDRSESETETALLLSEDAELQGLEATARRSVALLMSVRGDSRGALAAFRDVLALYATVDDRRGRANATGDRRTRTDSRRNGGIAHRH